MARHVPGQTVDVGQQTVAQADGMLDGIENRLSPFAELVNLTGRIGTVAAEYRTEKGILHPSHVELLKLRIARRRAGTVGVVGAAEESSYVGVEVGTAGHGIVQTERYLLAQHVP